MAFSAFRTRLLFAALDMFEVLPRDQSNLGVLMTPDPWCVIQTKAGRTYRVDLERYDDDLALGYCEPAHVLVYRKL